MAVRERHTLIARMCVGLLKVQAFAAHQSWEPRHDSPQSFL